MCKDPKHSREWGGGGDWYSRALSQYPSTLTLSLYLLSNVCLAQISLYRPSFLPRPPSSPAWYLRRCVDPPSSPPLFISCLLRVMSQCRPSFLPAPLHLLLATCYKAPCYAPGPAVQEGRDIPGHGHGCGLQGAPGAGRGRGNCRACLPVLFGEVPVSCALTTSYMCLQPDHYLLRQKSCMVQVKGQMEVPQLQKRRARGGLMDRGTTATV
eukprot:jgi/Botrbrau1/9089/Bobra.178_2s0020.1